MADPQLRYLEELKTKLGSFPERYGKATIEERQALRGVEPPTDLTLCHRTLSEELHKILQVLDQYNYDQILEQWQVANLVLFLGEIDSPVVKWVPKFGLLHLPDSLDPRHFETKRNFYDIEPSQTRTIWPSGFASSIMQPESTLATEAAGRETVDDTSRQSMLETHGNWPMFFLPSPCL
jgi:hypothetical protein